MRGEFRQLFANPSRDICASPPSRAPRPPRTSRSSFASPAVARSRRRSPSRQARARLAFENRDPFPHKLYQVSSTTWHAEVINPAARREWTATGAGRFEFRDELFPSVRTFVVVDPGVVDVAYPGHDGAFAYSALPPGDYILKAFFQGKVVGKPVAVTVKGPLLVDLKEPLNVGEAGQ